MSLETERKRERKLENRRDRDSDRENQMVIREQVSGCESKWANASEQIVE